MTIFRWLIAAAFVAALAAPSAYAQDFPTRLVHLVVPQAAGGSNSYRNLVSCCLDCNSRKRDLSAADFLRHLFRQGRLSAKDLSARLRTLQDLAAGKLRPKLSTTQDAASDPSKASRVAVDNSSAAPPPARVPLSPTHV